MKGILGLVGIFAATGAFSQAQVESAKTASGLSLGKPYASLQLRHYNENNFDANDKINSTNVYVQGRATLGTLLRDGLIDLSVLLKYKLEDQNNKVQTAQPLLDLTVNAYSGDYGTAKVYANYKPETDSARSTGGLGAYYGTPAYDLVGVKLSADLDAFATLHNAATVKAPVFDANGVVKAKDKDGKATDKNVETNINAEDPTLGTAAGVYANYSVPAVSGLSFGLGSIYYTTHKPEYKTSVSVNDSGEEVVNINDSKYNSSSSTQSHAIVGYKLTPTLKLDNTTYYSNKDFFGAPAGDRRIINRIRLSYTLF